MLSKIVAHLSEVADTVDLANVAWCRNIHGARAVHAACMGIGRTNDKTTSQSDRAARALAVLEVLSEAGADLVVENHEGQAIEVCEGMAEMLGEKEFGKSWRKLQRKQRVARRRKAKREL